MKKIYFFYFFVLWTMGYGLWANSYAQEQIEILTYYPAPYGVYQTMQVGQTGHFITMDYDATNQRNRIYSPWNANELFISHNPDHPDILIGRTGNVSISGPVSIYRGYSDAAGATPDLYVQNTGNIGIGTTNPGTPLEISSTTDAILRLRQNQSGNVWNYIDWYNDTNRQWWTGMTNSGEFKICRENATGNIVLDPEDGNIILAPTAGKVAIGTSVPQATLHVFNPSFANIVLGASNADGVTGVYLSKDNPAVTDPATAWAAIIAVNSTKELQFWHGTTDPAGATTFYSNNLERMRIQPDGTVCINTTTDSTANLYVNGSIRASGKISGGSFSYEMVVGPPDLKIGDIVEYTGKIASKVELGGAIAYIGKVKKCINPKSKEAWIIVSRNPESNEFSKAKENEMTYGILLSGTVICAKLKGTGKKGDYLVNTDDSRVEVDNNGPRGTIIGQLVTDINEETSELIPIMGVRY